MDCKLASHRQSSIHDDDQDYYYSCKYIVFFFQKESDPTAKFLLAFITSDQRSSRIYWVPSQQRDRVG